MMWAGPYWVRHSAGGPDKARPTSRKKRALHRGQPERSAAEDDDVTARVLRRFLLKDGVRVLFADDQTTHHYASLFGQLRKQGTPIPTNDMWLAALVLQHNLALHARDTHFDRLPQLVRV